MKPLEDFLIEKRQVTIHTLASYLRQYICDQWRTVLQEQQEELLHLFDKAGEVAYGVYGRSLFHPLNEQLEHAGFPGDFRSTSIEYWGPPEERERCIQPFTLQPYPNPKIRSITGWIVSQRGMMTS
jgi:hypothetical protein